MNIKDGTFLVSQMWLSSATVTARDDWTIWLPLGMGVFLTAIYIVMVINNWGNDE